MDPVAEINVRRRIVESGLQIVGWYHSHPVFRPDPSLVDLENQRNYQKLFHDPDSASEPFVGVIVGPYDPSMPGPISAINWFHVADSNADELLPQQLRAEVDSEDNVFAKAQADEIVIIAINSLVGVA